MGTADSLDRKQAERDVAKGFLELVVVAGLSLAAIAVPVALFVFLRPFGPFVALAVVALGTWWFAASAGFGLAALAFGLAGGLLLLLPRIGLVFVHFWRPNPFQWLGRESVALAVLYVVLFATAWLRTWRAGA